MRKLELGAWSLEPGAWSACSALGVIVRYPLTVHRLPFVTSHVTRKFSRTVHGPRSHGPRPSAQCDVLQAPGSRLPAILRLPPKTVIRCPLAVYRPSHPVTNKVSRARPTAISSMRNAPSSRPGLQAILRLPQKKIGTNAPPLNSQISILNSALLTQKKTPF